jgi:hypothetical protein
MQEEPEGVDGQGATTEEMPNKISESLDIGRRRGRGGREEGGEGGGGVEEHHGSSRLLDSAKLPGTGIVDTWEFRIGESGRNCT